MDDYYSDSQPALIHCKFCGEDYAATYKYCPFCNTAPNGKKMGPSARNKQKRGGGAGCAPIPVAAAMAEPAARWR